MSEWLTELGLPALFLMSFAASTLLPLGSEWLLAALLVKGADPFSALALATAGNTLGALTTYFIGIYGGPWLIEKCLRMDEKARRRAEAFYARYGVWSLLLSWLPVVGDPLCLVGGLCRVPLWRFAALVLCGKFARYALVCWGTLAATA